MIPAILIACASPVATDGDSIRCTGKREALRLHSIDAPEMPGSPSCNPPRKGWCDHRKAIEARDYLRDILRSGPVTYRITGDGSWGRQSAKVYVNNVDVECAMVKAGLAVVRYGRLSCAP